jgi:hypothetical protein
VAAAEPPGRGATRSDEQPVATTADNSKAMWQREAKFTA